jgi:peptidoglycan/xylan/chitin deacetylase (PgdA/CDA1 family)
MADGKESHASVAILLYHRVGEVGRDPLGLNISPASFEAQARAASATFDFIPLSEALTRAGKTVARPALAMTFDDGYSGVLHHAQPVLERLAIPFCVFVSTGFLDSKREFWWDELEALLASDHPLPDALEIQVGARSIKWRDGGRARGLRNRRVTPRERLYYDLARALIDAPEPERQRTLPALREWASCAPPARRDRMPLDTEELCALATSDLVEIGAHTVSHPRLSIVDQQTRHREIVQSKIDLESAMDRQVHSFAYPFGSPRDYTSATVNHVIAAGFERACANIQAPVAAESSAFQLPRFIVHDWDPATFMRNVVALLGSKNLRRRIR